MKILGTKQDEDGVYKRYVAECTNRFCTLNCAYRGCCEFRPQKFKDMDKEEGFSDGS